MPNDDSISMEETAYLLRNPNGANRLLGALVRIRSGEFEAHELTEIDDE
ncbi:MAG: hypothetical protein KF808_06820 [Cryobacterium sp.]|nr:hypothetical protein [Cryobacterium sp.]